MKRCKRGISHRAANDGAALTVSIPPLVWVRSRSTACETFPQLGQTGAGRIGQFQGAVVTMKQLDVEIFLQRPDLVADCCRRHIKLDCGFFNT
jgi:hypothetical protein